jgi:two-component sensor histidine kinase
MIGQKASAFFKRWISPPVFDGDEDKTHRARLLSVMLNVGFLTTCLTLIGNILDRSTPPRNFVIDLCVIGLCLVLRPLLSAGRVRLVASLILIGIFAFQAIAMASEGTTLAPTTALFSLLVIGAGIFFNFWGIVVATITSSLVVGGLILARHAGVLPPPHFVESTFQWFTFTLTFVVTGGLAYFSQQLAKKALVRAEKEIKERRQAEAELRRSFRENQALLRELQHRAKNSFNMISGMIHLASGEGGSSETLDVLDQLNARVLSVAELYSLLYATGSFTEVRLDEYCGKLASALIGLRPDISLVTDMEAVVVTANRAAPIGLIATELITNSLKYAFPGGRRGRVTVSLRNGPDRAVLAVRDDGVGLPAGFDHSGSAGMGIKLVRGLANQVGGSFAIAGGEGGTSCSLEFAAEGA